MNLWLTKLIEKPEIYGFSEIIHMVYKTVYRLHSFINTHFWYGVSSWQSIANTDKNTVNW